MLTRQLEDVREEFEAGSELEVQRKHQLAEMVAQVLEEQRRQDMIWERIQQRKLEESLTITKNKQSIKGSVKAMKMQHRHVDEVKIRQKELATIAGREKVRREFAEIQTKFEISGT